jgi:hypothetical protein
MLERQGCRSQPILVTSHPRVQAAASQYYRAADRDQ